MMICISDRSISQPWSARCWRHWRSGIPWSCKCSDHFRLGRHTFANHVPSHLIAFCARNEICYLERTWLTELFQFILAKSVSFQFVSSLSWLNPVVSSLSWQRVPWQLFPRYILGTVIPSLPEEDKAGVLPEDSEYQDSKSVNWIMMRGIVMGVSMAMGVAQ